MKYYVALFQKIKDYYRTQSSDPAEIALICPSLRVYEDSEMKLLLPQMLITDELKGEALLKKQDISFQLNSIPSSDQYWDINPSNTLFNAYKKIIGVKQESDLQVESAEIKAAEKLLYDSNGNATREKKLYDKYSAQFDTLLTEWENHISAFSESLTEDEKALWTEKLNFILLKKEKITVDHKLLGFKKQLEEAMARINKTDGYDMFLASLNNTRSLFDNTVKTDLQSLASYYDINFVPYDFMTNDNGWIKLSLEKKELDELYEVAKGQDDLPEEIIAIDYDEKNIEGIELEFSIVSMQRSWFSLGPILSNYFKWKEVTPISDGETISIEYLLPAYPKKLLLMRNLKINIGPDVNAAVMNSLNQLISFGPILMKTQLFTNDSTKVNFLKATTNKNLIKSEQLNYLIKKGIENKDLSSLRKTTVVASTRGTAKEKPDTTKTLINKRLRGNTVFLRTHGATVTAKPAEKPTTAKTNPDLPVFTSFVISPQLFTKINLAPAEGIANVFFNLTDKLSGEAVYKCAISIKGNSNNRVFDIETDRNGLIKYGIPFGSYDIECRADGYKVFKSKLTIANTNNISLAYSLERDEVAFNSYFLLGMVCEKVPKIPQ